MTQLHVLNQDSNDEVKPEEVDGVDEEAGVGLDGLSDLGPVLGGRPGAEYVQELLEISFVGWRHCMVTFRKSQLVYCCFSDG